MRAAVFSPRGFVAHHLMQHLKSIGIKVMPVDVDLEQPIGDGDTVAALKSADIIFNCSGRNGGAEWNERSSCDAFVSNTLMALNLMDGVYLYGNDPITVHVVSSCGYPASPFRLSEDQYLEGKPATPGQGYAKRNLFIAAQLYNQQCGTKHVCVCPPTLYGEQDRFEPGRSKVVADLIMKVIAAKHGSNTPQLHSTDARREFMYVKDFVKYLVPLVLKFNQWDYPLVNLAPGEELTIGELYQMICKVAGYPHCYSPLFDVKTDRSCKLLSSCQCESLIGNLELTHMSDALTDTIQWYLNKLELDNEISTGVA